MKQSIQALRRLLRRLVTRQKTYTRSLQQLADSVDVLQATELQERITAPRDPSQLPPTHE